MQLKDRSLYSRIILPTSLALLAALISFFLRAYLAKTATLLFTVAVILSAWSGGIWGGIWATACSVAAIDFLFLHPIYRFGPLSFQDATATVVFSAAAIIVSRFVAKARITEEERAARKAAEDVNHAKDQLISQVAHELRNPLATISMAIDMWQQSPNDFETAKIAMETIKRSLKLEFMFVNDLVDWARLRTGKFELNVTTTRLDKVIDDAWSVVKKQAEASAIEKQVSIEADAVQVQADHDRLVQVFWNLFTNAVKFTPHGGKIMVRSQSDNDFIWLFVQDTGRGIDKESLPHLFDNLWQTSKQDSMLYGGLGLGLSIARQIIERHGGTIHAESEGKGKGATFIIRLKKPPRLAMS